MPNHQKGLTAEARQRAGGRRAMRLVRGMVILPRATELDVVASFRCRRTKTPTDRGSSDYRGLKLKKCSSALFGPMV